MSPIGILICCTFPSEVVPFVCLASVCWSLQCPISALTQVGGGGLLFRFTSSLALSGGGGSLFSPSMLLRLPAALYGVCPVLHAVPIFGYSPKVQTRLHLCFVPSLAGAAQTARSLTGVLSLSAVHFLPSAAPALVSAGAGRLRAPCV